MITLTALVASLQENCPVRNAIPSQAQYERAIKEAVADFSRRCSREKITTLAVVSGTATYDLPADFIRKIKLYDGSETYPYAGGVIVTAAGLIPTQGVTLLNYERQTIAGGKITIYPVPTYNLNRLLRYAAGWALSVDSENGEYYDDLTEAEAAIVLLKAEAECLTLQLNAEGGGVLAYRIGDESFDKSGGMQTMISDRDARRAEYKAACESYNGPVTLYGGC